MTSRFAGAVAGLAALVSAGIAPASAQNYDGPGLLRFGIYGQGTWLDATTSITANGVGTDSSLDKAGFGASFGYDWRSARILIGAEADVTTINDSYDFAGGSIAADYVSTFRGRLGFFVHPGLVLYGTGGFALMNAAYEPNNGAKEANSLSGWTAGGGVEYDWSGVVFFAEYLHMDFGQEKVTASPAAPAYTDVTADVARLGVKFKIGFDY